MNGSLLRKSGLFAGLLLSFFIANAQTSGIKFKLQLMPDGQYWGVYAKPTDDLSPSQNTLTGTGQVTIVMPLNYAWSSFTSVSGQWGGAQPSIVNGPSEAPTKSYVTIGFISDTPTIHYQGGEETLLFKFKKDGSCPDELYLLDSNDPFYSPNSIGNNIGNELSLFDFGNNFSLHTYVGNYAPYAWDCHDNDGDGILNAHEDTNGNGIYDYGVDASNLYENESSYFGHLLYKLKLMSDGQSWGVYVKPAEGINPHTNQTIVGSGQVTVVMPKHYAWNTLTSVNGTWTAHLPVDGPFENPTKRYMSFGFNNEPNPIPFQAGMETLLFTFKGDGTCPDDIYLMDNQQDPFNSLPNSYFNNPGNELTVFDIVSADVYEYGGNYALHAADCHDTDGDGFLNAHEDTNGNGIFDPEDVSDLNYNPCGLGFSSHPIDMNQCAGGSASFTANVIAQTGSNSNITYQWEVTADGINYSRITTAWSYGFSGWNSNTLTIDNVAGLNNRRFRLVAKKAGCTDIFSQTARLTVDGPLTVSWHPQDFTNCADEEAYFFSQITNPGFEGPDYVYKQWQMSADNGATWEDVRQLVDTINLNVHNFGGYDSDSFLISPIIGLNGYKFRSLAWTSTCDTVISNAATLHVSGPIEFTQHPQDMTVSLGEQACFSATAVNETGVGNMQYYWQRWTVGGWVNLQNNSVYEGAQTQNLCVQVNDFSTYNQRFRCGITSEFCEAQFSDQANLFIACSAGFTQQPGDVNACNGDIVSFSVEASNTSSQPSPLTYQWQVSTSGAIWSNLTDGNGVSGTNTTLLSLTASLNLNNFKYRCVLNTAECPNLPSQPASLRVGGSVKITSQPISFTNCASENATFSIQVPNTGTANYTYSWAYSTDGVNWVDLNNGTAIGGSSFTNTTTKTLTINNLSTQIDGFQFRVRVTNGCSTVFSNPAVLNVEGPITFAQQPESVSICSNKPVLFNTTVTNPGAGQMTYRWQYKAPNDDWRQFPTNIGAMSSIGVNNPTSPDAIWHGAFAQDLDLSNVDGLDGYQFRLMVSTANCSKASNEATLQVLDACQDEACDYDNDGILNELDGDYNECGSACLKVKLQLLPDSSGWAVMAKPFGGFVPSAINMTQQGRISVVAPSDFDFQGFSSVAGNWMPTNLEENIPGHPDRKCMTFELMAQQGVHIPYQIGEETTLFTFDKTGPCPDVLHILEQPWSGVEPNKLSGIDNGFAGGFDLCGVYARKAWRCKKPGGFGGPIIVVTTDSLETDSPQAVADRNGGIAAGSKTTETAWFTAAPNPAGDHVNITVSAALAEGQTRLLLFDLQGKKWQEVAVNEAVTRLELGGLPAGVYFVSLAQNGRVVQREKLVKH
jgi:hypothetical protein